MRHSEHVLVRPVVSEKSYALMDDGVYVFIVASDASKLEIRYRRRRRVRGEGQEGEHLEPQGKDAAEPPHEHGRATAPTRSGRSSHLPATTASTCSRRAERTFRMAAQKAKAHKPRSPLPDRRGLRRDHPLAPREVAHAPSRSTRWPQQLRPQDRASPRRRAQAPVPHHRLPARQRRRACEGRHDRVRPEPQRTDRLAALPRRREALHPGSGPGEGGRRAPERSGLGDQAGQRPAAALHPGRLDRAQHRASPGRRRETRPWRRHERSARRQRRVSSPRCGSLPPRCAVSPSTAAPPSARWETRRRSSISIGKAGRNRWKGIRPQTRGVAMNPVDHPLGGGEGKSSGGRHPISPWGKPEGRTRPRHEDLRPDDRASPAYPWSKTMSSMEGSEQYAA